jgi:hypothetical protein
MIRVSTYVIIIRIIVSILAIATFVACGYGWLVGINPT